MAKEICISSTPHETRLAILEDDQLAEIYYERENEYTLAGSIYNGRVTRVLPGMQSAFVDIGLERDAFLYVTDFLELEDQEETDELEKAASTAPQAPREVRAGGERGQRQRGERRERRPAPEAAPEAEEVELTAPEAPLFAEPSRPEQEATEEQGARRWRGRRRRRGGRGHAGAAQEGPGPSEEQPETARAVESEAEAAEAPEIHATAAPRAERAPGPFVLPGETLSKYGGPPTEPTRKPAAPEQPARSASTFRPSTLIEAPITWDGSGLLPGESLARHRDHTPEPEVQVDAEPQGTFADASSAQAATKLIEESLTPEPTVESPRGHLRQEEFVEEELTEETTEAPVEASVIEAAAEDEEELDESTDPESGASASHRVDPLPPSSFRLFGLGGKKKKDEPQSAAEANATAATTSVSSVSAFAPGSGLVEEEIIEGAEEYAPGQHLRHKTDEQDLYEYEEQTLQTQIRSGAIGEMLQEAHLDHRIDMN
ncbi:MAG: ribonuclease, partial [Terracidiphilus sp.]